MASMYKSALKKRDRSKDAADDNTARTPTVRNKQRVLILSTRGINSRQRHLMTDIEALLPHSKRGRRQQLVWRA